MTLAAKLAEPDKEAMSYVKSLDPYSMQAG